MELRNPWMDNSLPSAWSDSDESTKMPFQHYSYSDVYKQMNTPGLSHGLQRAALLLSRRQPRDFEEHSGSTQRRGSQPDRQRGQDVHGRPQRQWMARPGHPLRQPHRERRAAHHLRRPRRQPAQPRRNRCHRDAGQPEVRGQFRRPLGLGGLAIDRRDLGPQHRHEHQLARGAGPRDPRGPQFLLHPGPRPPGGWAPARSGGTLRPARPCG